jgi:ComF family protein
VDYAAPWDGWVQALKFGQGLPVAAAMASQLALAVHRRATSLEPCGEAIALPDGLIPLPLSRGRLQQRGYNQSERLAHHTGRLVGVKVLRGVLQRWVDLPPQAQSNRCDRLTRLQGVFGVPPGRSGRVLGRHVALIDDVCTTGATLDAAALALLDAGAASVCAWVYARTPPPADAAS